MRILVVSAKNKTVFNFRGDLIRDMVSRGCEVYVTGPNRDFVEDILALGVTRFIEIPLVKDNTSVTGDLHYYQALKKVIRQVSPDLVFGYNIKPVIYGSMAAGACGVKRVCAMVTGLGRVYGGRSLKTRGIRFITDRLYRRAFAICDRVIFQNGDDVREMTENGCLPPGKAVIVGGSGVNMDRFSRAPMPEAPVFLMVSRIIREKGVMEYCAAARELKKAHPEARCLLLGGFDSSIGALQPEDLSPYIEDGSIELCPEVKDPVSYYHKASVFVLPSYYREGLPRTILEAMSCGRPVITTDWTGCREAVEDGINGYLVPVRDSGSLEKRMADLCDMDRAQEMGNEALRICSKKYEVSIINRQMREALGY